MKQQTLDLGQMTAVSIPPVKDLTIREVEVLKWTAEGNTAAEVGDILSLRSRTVNFHITNAVRKMGVKNKMSAVVKAVRDGFF
nr:helix-turn-helix transcriptional regulator [uncultured Pseudomonas sp.]